MLTDYRIILASKSPRRKEILASLGIAFEAVNVGAADPGFSRDDEPRLEKESSISYVERTAREKALKALALYRNEKVLVISADTIVFADGEILGKPASPEEEKTFLKKLSGRTHKVLTSLCAGTAPGDIKTRTSVTEVTFKALSDEEIAAYAATDEPYDKAGGYAAQGLAGMFITRMSGSPTGVIGLPKELLYELLREFGADPFKKFSALPA